MTSKWKFDRYRSDKLLLARYHIKAQPGVLSPHNHTIRYETANPLIVFDPHCVVQLSGRGRVVYGPFSYVTDGLSHISPLTGAPHMFPSGESAAEALTDIEFVCITALPRRTYVDYSILTAPANVPAADDQFIVKLAGDGELDRIAFFGFGGAVEVQPLDVFAVLRVRPVPRNMMRVGVRQSMIEHARSRDAAVAPTPSPLDPTESQMHDFMSQVAADDDEVERTIAHFADRPDAL